MNNEDENEDENEKHPSLESIIGTPEQKLLPRQVIIDPDEDDYEFAKNNIKRTIEKGNMAFDEILDIASQSGHPHAYEIVSAHFKNLIEANRQLMETKRLDQVVKGVNTRLNKPDVLNQNVFVGSTADLAKMLSAKRDSDENNNE